DQEAANDDSDKAAWKPWHWHGVADKHSGNRRSDQAGDEGRAPSAVARLLVDEAVKNSADAGDAASEQHEQYSRKPDQRATDCRGDRSEIGHDIPWQPGGCPQWAAPLERDPIGPISTPLLPHHGPFSFFPSVDPAFDMTGGF